MESIVLAFLSVYVLVILAPLAFGQGDIISLCNRTPYPEICTSFVTIEPKENLDQTLIVFRESALRATMALAKQAHELISTMDANLFDDSTRSAWYDCVNLYDDTVNNLINCILYSDRLADVQTWLSAAISNTQKCGNGFSDFKFVTDKDSFPSMLSDFEKLLSNSLAINVASISTPRDAVFNDQTVNLDFPDWLSSHDRKLLHIGSQSGGRGRWRADDQVVADLVVALDGSGAFRTINEALEASARLSKGRERFVIYVKQGVYRENVVIQDSMENYMFIGDGIHSTIVTGSRNVKDGVKTLNSATFTVEGNRFIARDMTFENTAGPTKGGAVALRSESDSSVFYRCSFEGYQDTLYLHKNRQFYRECDILGTVDFIFGDAAAILQNCNIYVRRPLHGQSNTITAQGRKTLEANTGIVIHNSRVTAASDLIPVQHLVKTYLGRPWKKYSRTVFIKTYLDSLIDPAGWLSWEGKPDHVNTLYYAEYKNTGPGADTSGRVTWPGYHVISNAAEARQFSFGNFLGGSSWIRASKVPFFSGL